MSEAEEEGVMLRAKGIQPTRIDGFDALRRWLDLFQAQDMTVYFVSPCGGGELHKVVGEEDYRLASQHGADLIALSREEFAVGNKENATPVAVAFTATATATTPAAVRLGVGRTPVKYTASDIELFNLANYTPQPQHGDDKDDAGIEWSTPQFTANRVRRLSLDETVPVREPPRAAWKSVLAVMALGLALAVGFYLQAATSANGMGFAKAELVSERIHFENQFATEQRLAQQVLEQTRKEILQAEAELARKRLEQEKELKRQEEVERKRLQEELESTRQQAKAELAEERKRLHQEHLLTEQRRREAEAEQQRIAKEAERVAKEAERIAKEAERVAKEAELIKEAERVAKEAELTKKAELTLEAELTKEAKRIAKDVEQQRIAKKTEQNRQRDDEKRRLDKELEDELEIALAGFQEMERELEARRAQQLAEQAREQQRLAEQREQEQLAAKRKQDELQQQRLRDYEQLQALQQRKRELQPGRTQELEQLELEDERLRQERLKRIRQTPLSAQRAGDVLHELVYGSKLLPQWIKQRLLPLE